MPRHSAKEDAVSVGNLSFCIITLKVPRLQERTWRVFHIDKPPRAQPFLRIVDWDAKLDRLTSEIAVEIGAAHFGVWNRAVDYGGVDIVEDDCAVGSRLFAHKRKQPFHRLGSQVGKHPLDQMQCLLRGVVSVLCQLFAQRLRLEVHRHERKREIHFVQKHFDPFLLCSLCSRRVHFKDMGAAQLAGKAIGARIIARAENHQLVDSFRRHLQQILIDDAFACQQPADHPRSALLCQTQLAQIVDHPVQILADKVARIRIVDDPFCRGTFSLNRPDGRDSQRCKTGAFFSTHAAFASVSFSINCPVYYIRMSAPTDVTPRLYLAPPSTGKTEYVLATARSLARGLICQPIVCMPTPIQVRSAYKRLAALGGAIGVQVFTFDHLWAWILQRAHCIYTEPGDATRFRLMQRVLQDLASSGSLLHFHTIVHTQGLAEIMLERVAELTNALVEPDGLFAHWQQISAPARLLDIARIYVAWRKALAQRDWVDRAGVGRLALDVLHASSMPLASVPSPVFFDGFDFLTELQVQTVAAIASLPESDVTCTLTGDIRQRLESDASNDTRFQRTRRRLAVSLGVSARALPRVRPLSFLPPSLRRLHETIVLPPLNPGTEPERSGIDTAHANTKGVADLPQAHNADLQGFPSLQTIEATQRSTEVRAALRWIKRAIVEEQFAPETCALVVRDVATYRAVVTQVAREFGMAIDLQGDLPLRDHAFVAWIEGLLAAVRPDETGAPTLPREIVIDLWRSPWQENTRIDAPESAAELLEIAARQALLLSGVKAWRAALSLAATPREASPDQHGDGTVVHADEYGRVATAFERWLEIVTPPTRATAQAYVEWLESVVDTLVLAGVPTGNAELPDEPDAAHLRHVVAALDHVLRALVLSAAAFDSGTISYAEFVRDLSALLEGALYAPPVPAHGVFVGSLVHARGVPFACVTLVGMAEGELPQRIVEDPYFRQGDRLALQKEFQGVQGEPYGIEREYFEEALARAEQALLLTRPIFAEEGGRSEPSPYWLEIQNALQPPLLHEQAGRMVRFDDAASLVELVRSVAGAHTAGEDGGLPEWLSHRHGELLRYVHAAAEIVATRTRGAANQYDGNLHRWKERFAERFPYDSEWSPTALEGWISCHHFHYAGRVLRLEVIGRPEEGVARWQVGQIYHEILAAYFDPRASAQRTPERLDLLIATHLAAAPDTLGFLDTPAWRVEAESIARAIRESAAHLEKLPGEIVAVEMRFREQSALRLHADGEEIRIRGIIDRLDRMPAGGLRVIDYKTGKGGYDTPRPLLEGKRLQLALYAMAVEQMRDYDSVEDALYYFVHTGEAARWSLAAIEGGKERAYATAAAAASGAVQGIRDGNFVPEPPESGCPDYCPAAGWCWHYRPRGYGR